MCIFLQQSRGIRKPLIPAKLLHFYEEIGCMYLLKKYLFGTMNDILGVFRPVFLDFPRMLPQKFLIPHAVCW